jgi:hypothetical protein
MTDQPERAATPHVDDSPPFAVADRTLMRIRAANLDVVSGLDTATKAARR